MMKITSSGDVSGWQEYKFIILGIWSNDTDSQENGMNP